jgi:hypothetical protein
MDEIAGFTLTVPAVPLPYVPVVPPDVPIVLISSVLDVSMPELDMLILLITQLPLYELL